MGPSSFHGPFPGRDRTLPDGAAKFKKAGVDDPAIHFKDKLIRVTGMVIIKEKRPRIEVNDPNQIRIVDKEK